MTNDRYVAGQARILVPSPPGSHMTPGGEMEAWENVAHAVSKHEPVDEKGKTRSVCNQPVYLANPSDWPPLPTTRVQKCGDCLARTR